MTDEKETTTLELFRQIEENRFQSQRSFASQLDIAVGLANSYIKRCIRKGWIKMSKTPARRYAYFITPKGFAEKSRLTAAYLASSFQFYRMAREQCLECLRECVRKDWRRVVLYGASEMAEIAALAAREIPMELTAVVAAQDGLEEYAGLPVVHELDALGHIDVVLITNITRPQAVFDQLRQRFPPARILTPRVLNVSREQP
jgi:DNA-binding MarR family transcriptional regulator